MKHYLVSALHGISYVRYYFKDSPRTPLRLLSIMGFAFGAKLQARCYVREHAIIAMALCDCIAEINKFYDKKDFTLSDYKSIRKAVGNSVLATCSLKQYAKHLRTFIPKSYEGCLPHRPMIFFREQEMQIIVQALSAHFGLSSSSGFEKGSFVSGMYHIGLLCQLYDDLLDRKADKQRQLPSLVQAYGDSKWRRVAVLARARRYVRRVRTVATPGGRSLYLVAIIVYALIGLRLLYHRVLRRAL